MNQDIEVVTDPPAPREPTPEYVKWRNRALACSIIFIVASHALVWFSTWSHDRGNSFMEICAIWLTISGAAGIASTVTYADTKDTYKRQHRGQGRGGYYQYED